MMQRPHFHPQPLRCFEVLFLQHLDQAVALRRPAAQDADVVRRIPGQRGELGDGGLRIRVERRQRLGRQHDPLGIGPRRRVAVELRVRHAVQLREDRLRRVDPHRVGQPLVVPAGLLGELHRLVHRRHRIRRQQLQQVGRVGLALHLLGRGADEPGLAELVRRGERVGVDGEERVHLVAEEVDPDRAQRKLDALRVFQCARRREDVHQPAADREVARLLDRVPPLVARGVEPADQLARRNLRARHQRLCEPRRRLRPRHRLHQCLNGGHDDPRLTPGSCAPGSRVPGSCTA